MLRAVRIVVIYHSAYRYKYAGLVKWTKLRKAWASITLLMVVVAIILYAISARHYRHDYGCAFFEETIVIGTMALLNAPGFTFLLFKLSQVQDVYKLRREFTWVFNAVSSSTYVYILIQVLYKTGAVTETRTLHLVLEILALVIMLSFLFWMVLISVGIHDGWRWFGTSTVVPTEGWAVSASNRSSGPTHGDGVLGYAQEGGSVASMFEQYCMRSLCAESWDFIVAACKYEEISDPEEQYKMFLRITEEYLRPTSPQEVNISSKMQAKMVSLQDSVKFSSLDGDSRRNVLQEPLKEVVRMLEENLLNKFKQTPEMRKRREDLEREDWQVVGDLF
ncbi:unnamed protein product [Ectocarpus sp. CCAP 1310/34]|nr:unnamed protein product [Ectocarpus sp. CCAP 1310/34]